MSYGPSIRELKAIVESYNHAIEEEFATQPEKADMWNAPLDDPFRDNEPAQPIEIRAIEDVPELYMRAGDTLYVKPTNNAAEVYSEENGQTIDWDFLSHYASMGKIELDIGADMQDPGEMVPYVEEANRMPNGDPVPNSLMVDIEDTETWKNRNKPRNDFEPKTNMCPDCEGHGQVHSGGGDEHGMWDCERCNGEGAIFEGATRKDFRMVADLISKIEDPVLRQSSAEDHARMFALQNPLFRRDLFMAAAGVDESGPELDHLRHPDDIEEEALTELDRDTYISYMNKAALDGQNYAKQGMAAEMDDDLESADAHMGRFIKRTKGVGRAADTLLGPRFSDDKELDPHRGDLAMARSITKGYADEFSEDGEPNKPYATMKDGPDKYLFRKDNKQKLVGSADNEPENGEEELEETDMDKFIREMQIAAGIIAENENSNECTQCWQSPCECSQEDKDQQNRSWEETVDEGKLPDALKKHQFGTKDDDKEEPVDKDDSKDDKEAVDEDIINWMKRFNRLSTPVKEDCDESENAKKNDDGECSPFTHADENVDMVREEDVDEGIFDEDLLLAPPGDVGPGVDEDDWDNSGNVSVRRQPDISSFDRDMSVSEPDISSFDRDMSDSEPFSDDYPVDEDCKTCGGMSKPEGLDAHYDEHPFADFEDDSLPTNTKPWQEDCPDCNIEEAGPGEFDHDDDAIVDVGDSEDYEDYSGFNDEFEAMLGGSSDMPEAEYSGMYEMNNLRRLAGLEQLAEDSKEATKDHCPEDPEGHTFNDNSGLCSECSWTDQEIVDESEKLDEIDSSGVVAYDIADEKVFFVMQDVLGNELDFGPEDEVLVPAARNDQVMDALGQQGFEKDRDFRIAGEQYEDDLQNGYNDRSFSDGQDYFPKGANNQPSSDLGPSASGLADNPMSNKMRMVKKDDVYEAMKLSYRRHRKT